MKNVSRILCLVLAALCFFSMVPAVQAEQESVTMWDMTDCSGENIETCTDFTDAHGNQYQGAVLFDVALNSGAVYDLKGEYVRFTGTLTTSEDTNSESVYNIAIMLDGELAYSRMEFGKHDAPEKIDLDLTGVQKMEVLTGPTGGSYTFLYVADGFFYRSTQTNQQEGKRLQPLKDVHLVDGYHHHINYLVVDTFGDVHGNNHIFGGRGTSYSVHNLDGAYDTFTATIFASQHFIQYDTRSCTIYCDGKRVAHYEGINKQTIPFSIEIDVRNVRVLKIESEYQENIYWTGDVGSLVIGDAYLTPHVHSPGEVLEDIPATCTKAGKKTYICTGCGGSCGQEDYPAIGHAPGDWITTQHPTCGEFGLRIKNCETCGEVAEEEQIEKLEHIISDNWETLTEATCFEDGIEVRRCITCASAVEEKRIPSKDHQMGNWYTLDGSIWDPPIERERLCSLCGHEEQDWDYSLFWLKSTVVLLILSPLAAAVLIYWTATRTCGNLLKKYGLRKVLKAAQQLQEGAIQRVVADLRDEMNNP